MSNFLSWLLSDNVIRKFLLGIIIVLGFVLISVVLSTSAEKIVLPFVGIETKVYFLILNCGAIASISVGWWRIDGRYKKTIGALEQDTINEKARIRKLFDTAIKNINAKEDLKCIAAFNDFYRIAKIEPDQRQTIFDLLCSHLRQITQDKDYKNNLKPTEEVQNLLDILFKPKNGDILIFSGLKINLAEVHLRGADLQYANLPDAKMQGVNLRDANLRYANLQGIHLQRQYMKEEDLQGVDMQEAELHGADLLGARINRETIVIPDNWKEVVKLYDNEDGEKRPFVVVMNNKGEIEGRY